jgi:ribonuclease G
MTGVHLYVDHLPGETRIARVEDGRLRDLEVVRPENETLVGNIYLGRVTKVIGGIQSAFVDIGSDRAAFLALSELAREQATEGASVIVQVEKDAVGEKGAKVTAKVSLAGRFIVHTPVVPDIRISRRLGEGVAKRLEGIAGDFGAGEGGFIFRTAAADAPAEALIAEARSLRAGWADLKTKARGSRPPACLRAAPIPPLRALAEAVESGLEQAIFDDAALLAVGREWIERVAPQAADRLALHRGQEPLFESAGLEEQIDAALRPEVALPSGGRIILESTRALIAIDVDSGSAAALATNMEAAEAIAREVRLRNLAGQLVIDFLPQRGRQANDKLIDTLRAAFADDPCPAQIAGFTRLGLIEMTRERRRPPLAQVIGEGTGRSPLTLAYDALRRVPATARAAPGRPVAIRARAAVIAALKGPAREALAAAEAALGMALALEVDAAVDDIQVQALDLGRRNHG